MTFEEGHPVVPGRYNPSLGYYCWDIMLYYDDITHSQEIHHAYQLRFWEHAREHMLDEEFLPSLIETDRAMFVTVKSEQKQYNNAENQALVRIGNLLEIRTRVKIDGKFRIRFEHETYLKTKEKDSTPKCFATGYVDMVCVHSEKHSILQIPQTMINEVAIQSNEEATKTTPARKAIIRKKKAPNLTKENIDESKVIQWRVNDFDTDFTEVVYQAKYLQYYEHARKFVLSQNHAASELANNNLKLCFYKSDLTFKEAVRPADTIDIVTKKPRVDGAFRIVFEQEMYKDTEHKNIVNNAYVELICISNETNKMAALPKAFIEGLEKL
mmetsp:Transcript_10828/g.13547  ORF Transcript_10828/g.13547 Transcript_10828/m.13547 type:complete len:326 (-) Transcript_10828:511-1488(-)